MSQIVVQNKTCKLIENDHDFLSRLDHELSFEMQGAKYTKAYQGYFNYDGEFIKWDGKKRLLNSDLSFPRGLLQRVEELYHRFGKSYQITDYNNYQASQKISIDAALKKIDKEPRYYQIDAASKVNHHHYGILRMATGSGKTLVMALMTALLGKSTIIYVIGKDLLYQIHDLFSKIFDFKIGLVGDGNCEIADINIVSVWTAGCALGLGKKKLSLEDDGEKDVKSEKYNLIKDMLRRSKIHIFDECHVAACTTIQEIHRHINPEHIYGMSASPWRDDGQDLMIEALLGKYIVNISASELIERGFLVKPYIQFLKVPKMKGKAPYQTIYKQYIIDNEHRNNLIVDSTLHLIELGYKPLVLYSAINHGEIIESLLKNKVPCTLLSGKNDINLRDRAKDDLFNGKIKAILASKIFDIGVDIPFLSGLVCGGSGKSSVRALQRIGRVTRPFEDKTKSAIVDFHDQAKYLEDHSKERFNIYSSEPGYEVKWS